MTTGSYKYDIAFSFLHQDEELALQLHQLLKDRVRCFIYTEEQKRLAGRDGEKEFNKIFSEESRIVAVLYRPDWGKKTWTKIEETAIRNRGFENGYDFVTFIPLDRTASPPKWLPKNRLWVGLRRWGIEGAASAIESRVQEFGGEVTETTLLSKVVKADKELKEKRKREQLIGSTEGAQLADKEFEKLKMGFETKIKELTKQLQNWHIKVVANKQQGINILSYGHSISLQWYPYAQNSAERAYVFLIFLDGPLDENLERTDPFYDYKEIKTEKRKFDINQFDKYGWSDLDSGDDFVTSEKLIDNYLTEFFDVVKLHREKKKYY